MFPLGIEPYLIGGILVGFGTTTLSWFSKRKHFQKEKNIQERNWRLFLAIGIILGAIIHTLTLSPTGFWITSVQIWRLALGGLLVGFGTRLSQGCTSGHGISGLASLSTTSLYAVITFMGIAIVVANIVHIFGVLP